MHSIFSMIIDTVTGLLAVVLLLRFWMQAVRVRPPLQVSQFTFQLSDWLVKPLRRLVPGVGGYDWATLIGASLVATCATALKLGTFGIFSPWLLLVDSVFLLAQWIIYGWIGLLLVSVVFSWVNPHAPLAPFFYALSNPILRPIRRILPPIGSVDLSPIVAFLALQILLQVLAMSRPFFLSL